MNLLRTTTNMNKWKLQYWPGKWRTTSQCVFLCVNAVSANGRHVWTCLHQPEWNRSIQRWMRVSTAYNAGAMISHIFWNPTNSVFIILHLRPTAPINHLPLLGSHIFYIRNLVRHLFRLNPTLRLKPGWSDNGKRKITD